jgi:hypothetical protein
MDLGGEMTSMASKIRIDQAGFRNPWPGNIERRRGALEAIFAKARRFGLEQPDDGIFSLPEGLGRLIGYLDFVGAHLKNGNFRVAKKRSRDLA